MVDCLHRVSTSSVSAHWIGGVRSPRIAFAGILWMALCGPALCAVNVIALPRNAEIVVEGDSLTYGQDVTPGVNMPPINGSGQPRSRAPYPETLGTMLKQCHVSNHGYPGDRSVDGLVRWQNSKPAALTLMMYGSNDALNNGHASSGVVSVETFTEVMSLLLSKKRNQGSKVLILLPPPIKNANANLLIEKYRQAVRKLADQQSLPIVDVPEILKGIDPVWTADQVHLSEKSNIRIAEFLAQHIRCE